MRTIQVRYKDMKKYLIYNPEKAIFCYESEITRMFSIMLKRYEIKFAEYNCELKGYSYWNNSFTGEIYYKRPPLINGYGFFLDCEVCRNGQIVVTDETEGFRMIRDVCASMVFRHGFKLGITLHDNCLTDLANGLEEMLGELKAL